MAYLWLLKKPSALILRSCGNENTGSAVGIRRREEIECVIVQPPMVRRWVTTPARIKEFEQELLYAVRSRRHGPSRPCKTGDHCRWCAAKPVCPR
jgi:hypothetical protein